MKSTCNQIQETLAAEGPQAFREDERAQQHLEECEACFGFLETLVELDASLHALPVVDAPDTLVNQLLARPELTEKEMAKAPLLEMPTHQAIGFNWFRWAAIGAAAVVVLYIVMIPGLYQAQKSPPPERAVADRLDSLPEFRRQIPTPDEQETSERAREIYEDESKIQYARPNELAAPKLVAPDDIPAEEEFFGVPGGVEGGVPGGVLGGITGGLRDAPASPEPPKKRADLDANHRPGRGHRQVGAREPSHVR